MVSQEQAGQSPYRQFPEGSNFSFILNKLNPDGSLATRTYNAQIEATRGGGFFGQVLLLRGLSFILKTAIPDPWHDLWRRVNWGARDFPYQISELDAQLGQVKTDLIHDAIYGVTEGRFYAPRSFGYTRLPGTFAQGIERLSGRPPRYDNHLDEFRLFRQAQEKLTDIGYQLGLEHVGQVHKDNPFAMANIWWNPALKRYEWFDTLPAIKHTGRVWPIPLPFKFHDQIRRRFYPDTNDVTFDRIHTDMYLETIRKNEGLFSREALERMQGNIALYESLMRERENIGDSPRNFRGLAYAGKESAIGFGRGIINTATSAVRIPSVDNLVLAGVRQARDTGTITEEEFQEANELVQNLSYQERGKNRFLERLKGGSLLGGLYAYYHGSGLALKVPEFTAYAGLGLTEITDKVMRLDVASLITQEDWLVKSALFLGTFSGFRVLGGLNSYLATKLVGLLTRKNLDTCAILSAIPATGLHLAIPAQICADAGSKSKTIWHYAVRNVIAKISKINPAGGWGSEWEGRLWNVLGKRLEGWAKH